MQTEGDHGAGEAPQDARRESLLARLDEQLDENWIRDECTFEFLGFGDVQMVVSVRDSIIFVHHRRRGRVAFSTARFLGH